MNLSICIKKKPGKLILNLIHLGKKVGINKAIGYTILARIVQASGGSISIIFIARYLDKIEQGYYFTFGSLLAIQMFFELGLSNIITQFVAHETALLKWKSEEELEGAEVVKSRLSSLLHFCIKWFAIASLFLICLLIFVGYIFFNKYAIKGHDVNWMTPWILISIATGGSLIASPILSFFEGLGKVNEVSKIRLFQQSTQLILLLVFLTLNLKLYSSALAALLTLFVAPLWILISKKVKILIYIWNQLGTDFVSYKNEIFPYQWKIALSWISGYFIFQLFNPVIFANDGPIVAGQMGMTLAVLNGILSISLSWMNTKVPLFSNLIAVKNYNTLDSIFNQTLKQSNLITIIALTLLFSIIFLIKYFEFPIGNRFLPLSPFLLLCITTFVNQYVSALATYLRCHKEEPFFHQSVILGILTATSTLLLGKKYGVNGIVGGYFVIIVFIGLIWSLLIFKRKRAIWH